MLRMELKRRNHHIRAASFIGPGCRECTDVHCLTCDTHEYDLGGDGSVLEMIHQHVAR